MKKFMTMMLAVVPFGMMAQDAQGDYAMADNTFNVSYADLGGGFTTEEMNRANSPVVEITATDDLEDDMYKVSDMLLADPDFDVQENMIAYTKDLKTVYFSANRKIKTGKADAVKIKKSVQLQMFRADVAENGEWVNLEMLPINGKHHSTGHPALNKDDSKLYFVADGPESTGKTDIFVVDLLGDGTFGKPANLGEKINSEEREVFPLLDDSDVLFFESDIDSDNGELDVFASEVINDEPTTPIKLNVEATGSKEDYIAAFKAVDTEAMTLAEKEANLRDLEILLEAESLAEIARVEEVFSNTLKGNAYDFSKDTEVYTVQIGAFLEEVNTDDYNSSSVLYNHLYDDGYNRFYSGVFETYEEATAHLIDMKKEGYEDAFVLGLKGTTRFLPE
jgi:hypothetical protein